MHPSKALYSYNRRTTIDKRMVETQYTAMDYIYKAWHVYVVMSILLHPTGLHTVRMHAQHV